LLETLDPGVFRKVLRRFENAVLDEMRFDVPSHGKGEASDLAARLNGKALLWPLRCAKRESDYAAVTPLTRLRIASARQAGRRLQDRIHIWFVFASRALNNGAMSDHVYKKIELVGSSTTSIEEAVTNALSRAQKTIRNMRWFELVETRGQIEDGKINHWQVTVKVGFTLDK
jgi:flavin-binding protein dodecin